MFLYCIILELPTQIFISFHTRKNTDIFSTTTELSIIWQQASIRVMKNIFIRVRSIYAGIETSCTRSYLALNIFNLFRGNSSITIRTILTINTWVEYVRMLTEDNNLDDANISS